MNIIDAGYLNSNGEYVEDRMYFSFSYLSEEEKRKILMEEYEKEQQEMNSNEYGSSYTSAA